LINLSQVRVLLADDHFLIRQFVRRSLMDAGINHIDMANDGNEAVTLLGTSITENRIYDVVLLDWNMPNLSGIDVLAYVRSKPQYQNSAVVMFTAESEKNNIMKAIKSGATSYILKPISPADLSKKIREIIDWLENRRTGKV
jgi:two-component system chemotaxis response regulator CheY